MSNYGPTPILVKLHTTIGITLFILSIIRVYNHYKEVEPVLGNSSKTMKKIIKYSHRILLTITLILPLSGGAYLLVLTSESGSTYFTDITTYALFIHSGLAFVSMMFKATTVAAQL